MALSFGIFVAFSAMGLAVPALGFIDGGALYGQPFFQPNESGHQYYGEYGNGKSGHHGHHGRSGHHHSQNTSPAEAIARLHHRIESFYQHVSRVINEVNAFLGQPHNLHLHGLDGAQRIMDAVRDAEKDAEKLVERVLRSKSRRNIPPGQVHEMATYVANLRHHLASAFREVHMKVVQAETGTFAQYPQQYPGAVTVALPSMTQQQPGAVSQAGAVGSAWSGLAYCTDPTLHNNNNTPLCPAPLLFNTGLGKCCGSSPIYAGQQPTPQ
jgi:hypothetical protein